MSAADDGLKFPLHCPRNRAHLAFPNHTEINLAQRNAFCSRAADKHLVGDIQLVARDLCFFDLIS